MQGAASLPWTHTDAAADGRPAPAATFLRRSCGLFTAALLAANGATLAACDSAGASASGADPSGATVAGSVLTVDLGQATALMPVGGSLLVRSANALVVHAAEGDYRAFNSVCPHQHNTISQVQPVGASYRLRCPSHGWTYDLNGNPTGSAQRGTARYALVQTGQTLTITLA